MTKKICYQGADFQCLFRKSQKARRMRLTVHCDGRVVATVPQRFSIKIAQDFLSEKMPWVVRKLEEFKQKNTSLLSQGDRDEYLRLRRKTKNLILEKIAYFNQLYNLPFNRVCIRDQKTRWGSCSSDRNLNFNYKIIFLPEEFQNYIVVHELCHLQEMNHSSRFWQLMEKTIPNSRSLASRIRKM